MWNGERRSNQNIVDYYSSVAMDYQDVIVMIPTTKVDPTKINDLFSMVLNSLTPLEYYVVASLVDGHSSNVKFYRNEQCENTMRLYFTNPKDENWKLFLMFDPTHVFKCIPLSANFDFIKVLYNIERTKVVKMSYSQCNEILRR